MVLTTTMFVCIPLHPGTGGVLSQLFHVNEDSDLLDYARLSNSTVTSLNM